MRIDIMTDIETLGTKSDSTIIQISAIAFDIKTGNQIKPLQIRTDFNMIADISMNEKPLKITGDTLKWWLKTDKELFEKLLNSGKEPSENVLWLFYEWLSGLTLTYGKENVYLWGNGILFDNKMIQHQLESLNFEYPIFYKNDRDVRTLLDLTSAFTGKSEKEIKESFNDDNLVAHDAFDDVKYQIKLVSGCYNALINR